MTQRPPSGPPKAGDVMEINSIDFKGNHKKHAKKAFGSDYLRCTFGDDPENPDCFGYTAIKGSMLRFHGFDIIGGTGRYLGASGKVVKSKEVKGGSDFVVRIKLPVGPHSAGSRPRAPQRAASAVSRGAERPRSAIPSTSRRSSAASRHGSSPRSRCRCSSRSRRATRHRRTC